MGLAKERDAVLLCMDAFQVYRDMPILSASPGKEEIQMVPHHLYGILDPLEPFSLSQYYQLACRKAIELHKASKTPIFVGGAGLYMRVLLDGFEESNTAENPEFRHELREISQREGSLVLHRQLQDFDPQAADRIHPNDEKRLIRALEIARFSTGEKQRVDILAEICPRWEKLFLNLEREELYNRIRLRVDRMVRDGVEEEVRALLSKGLNSSHTAYHAIGVKETESYLKGLVSREEWIEIFKRNSCRFAKRQLTWFRSFPGLKHLNALP